MESPSFRLALTQELRDLEDVNDARVEALLPAVYDELRRLASHYLKAERPGHTLQPTDLVHEAYARLIDGARVDPKDRSHFLAISSRVMRRVLVDHARRKHALKRPDGRLRVTLNDLLIDGSGPELDMVALDEALSRYQELDPRAARVVELRFFSGLTIEETSGVLGVSTTTVVDDWTMARAWLGRQLGTTD